jgi:hypothetical protein
VVRSWRLNAAFALRRPVVERRDWYAGQVANLLRSQHVELVALVTHDDRSLLCGVPLFRLVSPSEMTVSPAGAAQLDDSCDALPDACLIDRQAADGQRWTRMGPASRNAAGASASSGVGGRRRGPLRRLVDDGSGTGPQRNRPHTAIGVIRRRPAEPGCPDGSGRTRRRRWTRR